MISVLDFLISQASTRFNLGISIKEAWVGFAGAFSQSNVVRLMWIKYCLKHKTRFVGLFSPNLDYEWPDLCTGSSLWDKCSWQDWLHSCRGKSTFELSSAFRYCNFRLLQDAIRHEQVICEMLIKHNGGLTAKDTSIVELAQVWIFHTLLLLGRCWQLI